MRPLCVLFILCLSCCNLLISQGVDRVCQAGRIVLQPDPAYGQKTNWAKVFPVHPLYGDTGEGALLTVASDGSCFVLNGIAYRIHKFSAAGELLMSWGKKGRNPGEFPSQPRSLMLLDDRYVLAADTSMGRINVYDRDGGFIKALQTDFPVHRMIALTNGRFAVTSSVGVKQGSKKFVAIMSLNGGKGKIIASRVKTVEKVTAKSRQNSIIVSSPFNFTHSFIDRTREGNLIYGVSDEPELIVYSPEGRKLGVIDLKLTSVPISAEEQDMAREGMRKKLADLASRFGEMEITETPHAFKGNTPYFTKLLVDGAGNALVLKFSKDEQRDFQVYEIRGNGGRMICEVAIESGALGSFKNLGTMTINRDFLYAIASPNKGENAGWRLIRVPWAAAAK